ncbi:CocE/NonD family hydrolase [Nonomuraea sp. CA-141351]|uniref:CocE/NonD family hydrolase n=1 Tax=Nonomuraea sp. CA-141351 TaxID=3239996 RepID=UPI003D93925D
MSGGVTVRRDVRIPTGELDVTLSADLFLPEPAGSPVPVLITVLPYRRDLAALGGTPMQRWFAARGYASMLVDLRGTGSSDGTPRPPLHQDDVDDALAAIDWAIGQPWCDGTAGMWGDSYGAVMALRAAAARPNGLKAIVAVQGLMDPETDFAHPGGTRGAAMPLAIWAKNTLLAQLLPPLDDPADPVEQARWRRRLEATPYLVDLFRHGPGHPDWARRRIDAAAIQIPTLCFAGWRDLFADGMIRAYEQVRGPKKLVAGPWMHGSPQWSPQAPIDFLNMALSWWDRWLLGKEAGTEPAVTFYAQGSRPRWLAAGRWPPGGADQKVDLGGWQLTEPAEVDHAVGALSGLWATPDGPFGLPLDQHDDDVRSICHTSPPLEGALLISGPPRVMLDNPWLRVSVKLVDVDADGRSTLICAGLTGTDEAMLAPTTYEIPAGHRLRVVLASGDFPRVWPYEPSGERRPVATLLSLPISGETAEIELQAPEPVAVDFEMREPPVWEIANDLINGTVSTRMASHGGCPARGLWIEQEFVATAHRTRPDATITCRVSAEVDGVAVNIDLTATSSAVRATGRVTRDGDLLLDRTWQAPEGHTR